MKIDHILFPIDFSEHSRPLNPEVEWLANRHGAKVTLLHVFEIPVSWYGAPEASLINPECLSQFEDGVKRRLKEYALNLPEGQVERVIAEGDPAWQIGRWVEEHDTDLIVMGTHGYGSLRRVLLGSVAMKVMHDVHCPIWTHSAAVAGAPSFRGGISTIVCALELIDEAVPLLKFAKELSAEFKAAVHLVHAVPGLEPRSYRYFDTDFHSFLKKAAQENIDKLQGEAGTAFQLHITDDAIAGDAADLARELDADLILIGRGKAQEILGTLRSHAYDIIRQAPCPVLSNCAQFQKADKLPLQAQTFAEQGK